MKLLNQNGKKIALLLPDVDYVFVDLEDGDTETTRIQFMPGVAEATKAYDEVRLLFPEGTGLRDAPTGTKIEMLLRDRLTGECRWVESETEYHGYDLESLPDAP